MVSCALAGKLLEAADDEGVDELDNMKLEIEEALDVAELDEGVLDEVAFDEVALDDDWIEAELNTGCADDTDVVCLLPPEPPPQPTRPTAMQNTIPHAGEKNLFIYLPLKVLNVKFQKTPYGSLPNT